MVTLGTRYLSMQTGDSAHLGESPASGDEDGSAGHRVVAEALAGATPIGGAKQSCDWPLPRTRSACSIVAGALVRRAADPTPKRSSTQSTPAPESVGEGAGVSPRTVRWRCDGEPPLLAYERECQAGNNEGREKDRQRPLSAASERNNVALGGVEGLSSAGVPAIADLQGVASRFDWYLDRVVHFD